MFPEDFGSPHINRKEYHLSWWGIVEPPKELLRSIDNPSTQERFPVEDSCKKSFHTSHNNWGGRPHPPLNKYDRDNPQFAPQNTQSYKHPFRNSNHCEQPNYHHRPLSNPHHPHPQPQLGRNRAGPRHEGG